VALIVGVVSPGPSFLMVARTAVASSRADGVAAGLAMAREACCLPSPRCWVTHLERLGLPTFENVPL